MNLLRQFFSVYNEDLHKVICVLGFKIKIKNSYRELKLLNKKLRDKICPACKYAEICKITPCKFY